MSFDPPLIPAPLLATDTVASSKLHEEAADTTAEPDSKREETRPWKSLIVADFENVNAELSMLRGGRRKRVLCQAQTFCGPRHPMSLFDGGSASVLNTIRHYQDITRVMKVH